MRLFIFGKNGTNCIAYEYKVNLSKTCCGQPLLLPMVFFPLLAKKGELVFWAVRVAQGDFGADIKWQLSRIFVQSVESRQAYRRHCAPIRWTIKIEGEGIQKAWKVS